MQNLFGFQDIHTDNPFANTAGIVTADHPVGEKAGIVTADHPVGERAGIVTADHPVGEKNAGFAPWIVQPSAMGGGFGMANPFASVDCGTRPSGGPFAGMF
jgi:hypothetical protein